MFLVSKLNNITHSLYTKLGTIIFIVVIVISSIDLAFSYMYTQNALIQNIKQSSKSAGVTLKNNIDDYIMSYSVQEYDNLVSSQMEQKDILAIVVEDYNMGRILGKNIYISGKIRNEQWQVVDYDQNSKIQNKQLKNAYHFDKYTIFDKGDNKIGIITIYLSDKFMKRELEKIIISYAFNASFIALFLILSLFFMIRLIILQPLAKMVNVIKNSNKDGIPQCEFDTSSSMEINELVEKMNTMMETIRVSRQQLEEQKEEFEMIFNNTKDGIAILDLESNFLNFNEAYLSMTGYTKEELLKKSCISLTIPEERARIEKLIKNIIQIGHIENLEKSCMVKDDKIIHINMSITLLPDQKRLLATTKDVTKLKLIESQAKLASMGEMIGNIAHQWRQPLSVISTGATGMKMQKEFGALSDEEFNKICDLINENAQYLSRTIDDFRNFIKGGEKARDITISSIIEKTLNIVSSSLENNYIKVVINIDDDMKIFGYENEIIQALVNIINNAKDAIVSTLVNNEDKRLLFITTKKVSNEIELSIKDNGGGIPEDVLPKIFEPYFTTKHQSVGTGIGLSMAYRILTEHHNATIIATNEKYEYDAKEYKGACLKITFHV